MYSMHLFFWDVYPAVDIFRGMSEHSQSVNIINFSWIMNRFILLAEMSLLSAGVGRVAGGAWAAGRVLDGLEGCVSSCLSCCSVLLVGFAGCPVPSGRGGAVSVRVFRACSGLGLRGAVSRVVLLLAVVDHLVDPLVP